MTRKDLRVQLAHGLEGSPQGSKSRALGAYFEAETPAMDTTDFEACVAVHAEALRRFRPHVLVGSSFGGAVVVALLERGDWRGPTLLLAQAARLYDPSVRLPAGVPVILVHAPGDDVVPVDDSRQLAKTGSPELVRLLEPDDDHSLHRFVASGQLVRLVERLADGAP